MSQAQGFRRPFSSQVAWYLVVGTLGFLSDALAYWVFAHVFGWPVTPARLAAFAPATLATWAINRRYTFARDDNAASSALWQYMRYLAVQGGGIVVSFITFQSLLVKYPSHDLLALAAGSIVALGFNFAGSRLLVFTGKAADASPLVVAAFGALSMLLGQDTNWDLLNYHLYNVYALLNDRLHIDLAPAGVQSYFNPLLDLPYYAMTVSLPAPAVAFIMGALHGLCAVFLAAVVKRVLPEASSRLVWALALAGCLGATFFAGIGNTMGDNTTAVLVLGAMALCVQATGSLASRRSRVALGCAGLLVGLATGLKLTNAPFALALAAGLAVCAAPLRDRARAIALLTAGGVVGLLLATGWWWARMWIEFGNPTFPQFNSFFGSPMATAMKTIDPRWGPKTALEAVFYPLVFMADPYRAGEMGVRNWLWPVTYLLVAIWGLRAVIGRVRGQAGQLTAPMRFVLAFMAVSYLGWLSVFAIGRYATVIEVLFPLVVWLLLPRVWPSRLAPKAAAALIAISVMASLVLFKTWGHASFAERSYTPPELALADASRATVVFIAQPVAWMAPFLPPELAFVSLFNFPESPAYVARAKTIFSERGGPVWAVLPAVTDTQAETARRFNETLARHSVAADALVCRSIKPLLQLSRRYRSYVLADGPVCQFKAPAGPQRDIAAEERQVVAQWAVALRTHGLTLDEGSCRRLEGRIGDQSQPSQFCRIAR
ncbi:hypothetical protein GHT07_18040 [Caenimonas koreensis DSM 17982]|uniref:GtrA/DPMS transmembrane domain-containing protein n=1 Tax=Caenimonas koreensis DSM 17982 TaxID=1121255 RepID=A0A844BFE8_9BURK|nr:GtrA family protein [Caenimonas koreensis]MRD49181.1 hypothetical protein [Caenimonas koreensis DSM 17982]